MKRAACPAAGPSRTRTCPRRATPSSASPRCLRPVHMHKGILMEAVRLIGRSGHSSDPSLGKNALEGMHKAIAGAAHLPGRATAPAPRPSLQGTDPDPEPGPHQGRRQPEPHLPGVRAAFRHPHPARHDRGSGAQGSPRTATSGAGWQRPGSAVPQPVRRHGSPGDAGHLGAGEVSGRAHGPQSGSRGLRHRRSLPAEARACRR